MNALTSVFRFLSGSASDSDRPDDSEPRGRIGANLEAYDPMYNVMEDSCLHTWLHRSSTLSYLGDYEAWMLAREMHPVRT